MAATYELDTKLITPERLLELDAETRASGPSTLLSGELRKLVRVYLEAQSDRRRLQAMALRWAQRCNGPESIAPRPPAEAIGQCLDELRECTTLADFVRSVGSESPELERPNSGREG